MTVRVAHQRQLEYQRGNFVDVYGYGGPNSLMALIQRLHMENFGTTLEQIGKIAVAQRFNAMNNPQALFRAPMSMQDYLISRMISDWIVGLLVKETASKAANSRDTVRDAMAAARGAYKAMVGIPIIGPILAPIAAGVAFAAVSAFSAEGGDVQVKPGLYELHKDEMVLPEWAATPLRNSLLGGSGVPSFGAPANDTGGDVHLHVHAIDGRSAHRFLQDNKHSVAKAVNAAVRNGFQR